MFIKADWSGSGSCMVEMTEVAIATTSEYVSLSASSTVGYMAFKALITGSARFLNSRAVKSFKSSATKSPRENGPMTWKDQTTMRLSRKSRAYPTVHDQCLLPRKESNLVGDES